jgi:amino acid transporter
MSDDNAVLKRSISLPLITFYGVGTILGAGVYVLIGKIVAQAGLFAPISFLVAALIAAFTGLSYAELSSRYSESAGEAVYLKRAFNSNGLSILAGYAVVFIGLVSAAAIANGFVGYFHVFVDAPRWLILTVLVCGMGLLAILGIVESVGAATIITLIEIGGLIMVLFVAGDAFLELPAKLPELIPSANMADWTGILAGGFLAFYAFIGFEDMVNVAEEVIDPKVNLPKSIVIAIWSTTILYVLMALVAILAVDPERLAQSDAPLAMVISEKGQMSPAVISLISMLAVVNGALIQIIMASRVLFGMAKAGNSLNIFAKISTKTRTPVLATIFTTGLVLVLAIWFPIEELARTTSLTTLIIFALVNLALIKLKMSKASAAGAKTYHFSIPVIGFLLCAGMSLAYLL